MSKHLNEENVGRIVNATMQVVSGIGTIASICLAMTNHTKPSDDSKKTTKVELEKRE